jgi:hypothetical protein
MSELYESVGLQRSSSFKPRREMQGNQLAATRASPVNLVLVNPTEHANSFLDQESLLSLYSKEPFVGMISTIRLFRAEVSIAV